MTVSVVYPNPRSKPNRAAQMQFSFTIKAPAFAQTFTYDNRERAEQERARWAGEEREQ